MISKNMETCVGELFDKIQPILYKYSIKKEERRERGEDFNIFWTMRKQYDEVHTHSAIISALLNPKEVHGCKSSFLRAFLHHIKELKQYEDKISDTEDAVIEVEKNIGKISQDGETGGRLDIVVKFKTKEDKSILVIIENKINADDEKKQLIRYRNYAENCHSQKGCSDYYIFYLTLEGRIPSVDSTCNRLECDKDYYCISYRDDILNWLCNCQKEANGKPLVHGIITQYKELILTLTNQNMDMETQLELAKAIVEKHQYMLVASAINNNYSQILKQMCEIKIDELCNNVMQKLNVDQNFKFTYNKYNITKEKGWLQQYSGVSFTKEEEWKHFSISFEFFKANLDKFRFGVKFLRSIKEEEKESLCQAVQDEFGNEESTSWYPYVRDTKYPDWTREDAIDALYNGEMESYILDEIQKNASKVDKIEASLKNNK